MQTREIMTRSVEVTTPDEPIARAAELMRDRDVGLIPVVSDRDTMHLEGVITDRDIAVRCVAERHAPGCRVADHMTRGTLDTVAPESDVHEVIAKMERDQVRRIPVVERGDRLVGIVAQADLATQLGPKEPQQIEELVERISRANAASQSAGQPSSAPASRRSGGVA